MTVRFGLLGPMVVGSEDAWKRINGSHVRGLLAALLLRANAIATRIDITLDLWCKAPSSADDNLRKFAMRLRRQLTAAGSELDGRLVTFRGGGYSLHVAPDELDLGRFRAAWEGGRAAMTTGQFQLAVAGLRGALALWRGRAGIDTPTEGLLANRLEVLNQEWLAAKEDLAAARIAVGDTIGLAEELTSHLAMWPTRERAAQLLLLLNYRSGDVSAALTTYRNTRASLVEELGVEPGERLRRMHRAALDRDDAMLYDNELLTGDSCLPALA